MKHILSCCCLLLALSPAQTADQAKLKPKPLPAPELTLTQVDLATDTLYEGRVRTPILVQFKPKETAAKTITLGGVNLAVSPSGNSLSIECDGRPYEVKTKGTDLLPTVMRLPDKSSLLVAVPIFEKGRTITNAYLRNGMVFAGKFGRDTLILYDADQDLALSAADSYCNISTPLLFAPIKRQMLGDNGLYEASAFAADGGDVLVDFSPATGETAKFSIKPNGGAAQLYAVFTKSDDSLAFVSDTKADSYQVPPGDYALSYGLALGRKGNSQIVAARIQTGDLKPVSVGAGGGEVTLGGPYQLRFQIQKTTVKGKPNLMINPSSVMVFGAQGEQYVEYTFQALPTVTLLGGKKPTSLGTFEYG
jgi:hypothetical protein